MKRFLETDDAAPPPADALSSAQQNAFLQEGTEGKRSKLIGPVIVNQDKAVVIDEVVHGGVTFWRATLPYGDAELLWTGWRDEWEKPVFPQDTPYHPVVVRGARVNQPRKTVCYDHAYAYSGTVHPVEAETPAAITKLYGIIEKMFGEKPNMCLANAYLHRYHSISDHSDDEKAMGDSHNVYCFSVGATRRLEIKHKNSPGVAVALELPEGLYVMRGELFQKNYTHGFPRTTFSFQHPDEDNRSALQKADWAAANPELVRAAIRPSRHAKFAKWCEARYSYTLRTFIEPSKD